MIIFCFANISGVGAICRAKAEISFCIILEVFLWAARSACPFLQFGCVLSCSLVNVFHDCFFRSSQQVPFFARASDRICWVIFWMFRHLLETVDGVCDIFSSCHLIQVLWFFFGWCGPKWPFSLQMTRHMGGFVCLWQMGGVFACLLMNHLSIGKEARIDGISGLFSGARHTLVGTPTRCGSWVV